MGGAYWENENDHLADQIKGILDGSPLNCSSHTNALDDDRQTQEVLQDLGLLTMGPTN